MSAMEEQLGTILKDPQLMQHIMAMAHSLGNPNGNREQTQESAQKDAPAGMPDLSMLQKLSGLAGQSGIDRDQRQLLQALSPYLCRDRITKLENAMRAAKMARLASLFFSSGGMKLLSGR